MVGQIPRTGLLLGLLDRPGIFVLAMDGVVDGAALGQRAEFGFLTGVFHCGHKPRRPAWLRRVRRRQLPKSNVRSTGSNLSRADRRSQLARSRTRRVCQATYRWFGLPSARADPSKLS